MADYLPLLWVGLLLALLSACAAWPWLRKPATREAAAVVCVVSVLLAMALYLAVGNPFTVSHIAVQQQQNLELQQRISTLSAELATAKNPNDAAHAEQWVELGAAHMQLSQFADAERAFKCAVVASEGNPQIIMAYGKAQMAAAEGEVTEGAAQAFAIASRLMPENPEPLFLLAVGKMQSGDREGGRELFRQLLPMLPEGAPLRQRILQRLKEAE